MSTLLDQVAQHHEVMRSIPSRSIQRFMLDSEVRDCILRGIARQEKE